MMTAVESACRRFALRALSGIRDGHLDLVEPGGKRLSFGPADAELATRLELWRERFIANTDLAAELGYDEPFRRLWTL
jgi:hypothetical protein